MSDFPTKLRRTHFELEMRLLANRTFRREWSPQLQLFVCPDCSRAQQRRQFANSAPPKPPSAGLAALSTRQLLSVSGPEAAKFLQGIVTANVTGANGLPRTDAFYSGFLNATGRVMHDLFIYPFHSGSGLSTQQDGYLIEADASQIARVAKHIARYRLRAKVTVRNISQDEASVWQAWEDSSSPGLDIGSNESRMALRDPRAPGMGYRIIHLSSKKTPEVDLDTVNEDAYTIHRYLHGIPEGQDEMLREQALPLESNMDFMNGIDFHKGCYVGQELTIRTKHRGVVRKRILPCIIYDKDKAPPQKLLYDPECVCVSPEKLTAEMIPAETGFGRLGKKGRSAGKWLKGVGNIGLGLCRLEIMTDVVLPGEQAAALYTPENEFVLEWGGEENRSEVKVKAFVPDWLRDGLSA